MRKLIAFALCPLLWAACAAPRPAAVVAAPEPYVRVVSTDSNLFQLQVAIRKFVPGRSDRPAVWLVGASHLGDPKYYRALQDRLDVRTLVLCEGVRGGPENAPPAPATNSPRSNLGSLQQTAARSLGLVFQLDAINYHHPNFRNSDLSVEELQRLLTAPSTNGVAAGEQFDKLLSLMEGGTFFGSLVTTALNFVGSDAKLRGTARLLLIEMLGGMRGDLSKLQNLPPDLQRLLQALIESRNRKVMADLSQAARRIPPYGSIAILYGSAHMDDLEKRLRTELHYQPAGEEWLTAFSVDLAAAGISPTEAQYVQRFARMQMERLQPAQ